MLHILQQSHQVMQEDELELILLAQQVRYNDRGREVIENIYASVFGAEDALGHQLPAVRMLWLYALWSPTAEMSFYRCGKPCDTLDVRYVVPADGTLKDYQVTYRQVDLLKW